MSWKKSIFSYVMWIVYTAVLGMAMVSLGSGLCAAMGAEAWMGIPAALLYLALAGVLVILLHRTAGARQAFAERNHVLLLAAEAVFAAALFVAGVVLRISSVGEVMAESDYFTMAAVVEGQQIPQLVHGAVHFYVQLLHGIFLLLGNQYAAGIGLQIALQLTASVGLYFIVRKLAGAFSALVTFGLCMCAPYMLQAALTLSPSMLFFLLLTAAAGMTVAVSGGRLRLPVFALIGILTAFCCYMDISGLLLLALAFACAFSEREETSLGRQLSAAGVCLLSCVCGLLVFIGADAFISGKSFAKVAEAWFALYRPEEFALPFELGMTGTGAEEAVLFGLMTFGIFGFWCDRRREYLSPYAAAACFLLIGSCYGIFTEEMPGNFALYVIFALLAGSGVGQCFHGASETAVPAKGEAEKSFRERVKRKKPEREMSTEKILAQEARLWEVGFAMEAGEKAFFESAGETSAGKSDAAGDQEAAAGLKKKEKELQESFRQTDAAEGQNRENGEPAGEERKVRYLDNPLPLPKKHVKRVLDYSIHVAEGDDFDYPVRDDDDFDI